MDNLFICRKCMNESKSIPYSSPFQYRGMYINYKVPENKICQKCKSKLDDTKISMDDIKIIYNISHDISFIEAMIDLKQKDIIEYELKMSQFRAQTQQGQYQRESRVIQNDTTPKCPTCGSTNIEKISTGKKVFGGAMFGLFSADVRNTIHCKNCGYKW